MFTWDHTSVLRWRRDKRGLLWSGGLAGLSNTPNKPAFAFCREVCFDKTAHVAKHVWRHELGHLCALLLSFQYFLMKRNLNKKQNTETAHYLLIWKCCSRPGRYAAVVCSRSTLVWLIKVRCLLPFCLGFIRTAYCWY